MKYGVLYNKSNSNIGDDIQAWATARFLPRIDYFIDREKIDEFCSKNEEPVAVIMNAWYMWAKWHWPPSKYIIPKFIGFHYADHQLAKQPGTPFKYEFLTGMGCEYLKSNEPIGCRDMFTLGQLKKLGIDSYFSGCITMTIPHMPETQNKGNYICLVDVEPRVVKKIQKLLKDKPIEVKVITHRRESDSGLSWKKREKIVLELLTLYQNARCVVTKRLHCALPCLALETPVFIIKEMEDDIRFSPYYDFLHRTTVTKFMKDEYSYDFMNPPANKEDYKPYRERIIKDAENFVAEMEKENRGLEELVKTTYTDEEVLKWRHDLMKECMDKWLLEYRKLQVEMREIQSELKKIKSGEKINDCEKIEYDKLSSIENDFITRIRKSLKSKLRKLLKRG